MSDVISFGITSLPLLSCDVRGFDPCSDTPTKLIEKCYQSCNTKSVHIFNHLNIVKLLQLSVARSQLFLYSDRQKSRIVTILLSNPEEQS